MKKVAELEKNERLRKIQKKKEKKFEADLFNGSPLLDIVSLLLLCHIILQQQVEVPAQYIDVRDATAELGPSPHIHLKRVIRGQDQLLNIHKGKTKVKVKRQKSKVKKFKVRSSKVEEEERKEAKSSKSLFFFSTRTSRLVSTYSTKNRWRESWSFNAKGCGCAVHKSYTSLHGGKRKRKK